MATDKNCYDVPHGAEVNRLVNTILVRRTRIGYVPDVWTALRATEQPLADAA